MPSKKGLYWPVLASLVLPWLAAWFAYPDTHLPPKFGVFPPVFEPNAPGFNLVIFIVLSLVVLGIAALLLFPQWFGFKRVAPPAPAPRAKYPVWFWIGLVLTAFFWWLMWARVTPFGNLVYYAFTPLWYGFILVLDGLVYRRSNGNSMLASEPRTLLLTAAISMGAWLYFEYFDYFVLSNWYYPNGHMPELAHGLIVALFLIAYTTVWPVVLEAYTLLQTFPALSVRYSEGPKLALPGDLLLWGGLLLMVLMVFLPYPLFWVVWIGPLLVFSGMLIRHGVWTPYTAMAEGNWGPVLLSALASLLVAVFWEVWNFGSSHPSAEPLTNPNYWQYDIPYVNVIHLFSEMPLLGFAGYLPFGLMVWLVFIWAGLVLSFDTRPTWHGPKWAPQPA
jgi:hypothetical protein